MVHPGARINMKSNEMKIKRDKSNKRITLPVVGILVIISVYFYWYSLNTPSDNNQAAKINSQSALGQGEVTFISPDSTQKETVLVEIAEDDYSRATGLMSREELPGNQGMLFIFEEQRLQYFWMKNTHISLDMIFVDVDNKIVNIEKYTMPYSTQSYPSRAPAIYVVEVVAGYTDQYGIKTGWTIEWKRY